MDSPLPFLKKSGWPRIGKRPDLKEYGFSERDGLIEDVVEELCEAHKRRDHGAFLEAISALISLADEGNEDAS